MRLSIPLAFEALKQHRTHQLEAKLKAGPAWQDHDYVFCTSIGTHLTPTRDILDELKILLQKAGLPDIRFHDLCYSAATLLLNAGVHPKVIAAGAAKRLHLERLPGYAPDLNPQEDVWNLLKRRELKNLCCQQLSEVRTALVRAKERLRHRRTILQACFLHALGAL